MKAFLCSSPYNNHDKVFRKNSLRTQLKNAWPEKARICYIASDPDDYVTTDNSVRVHSRAYREHFKIDSWQTIDHRLYEPEKYLKKANIFIVAGGNCHKQIRYLHEIHFEEYLNKNNILLIGCSAGSMNMLKTVYVPPETEKEESDPDYVKFYEGYGLADILMVPHYVQLKNEVLNGKRIIDDIIAQDSMGKEIYLFPDATYLWIDGERKYIRGEFYLMKDGNITKMQETGDMCLVR